MKEIELVRYNWSKCSFDMNSVYVYGWAEYKGKILQSEEIANQLKIEILDNGVKSEIFSKELNGSFGIIIFKDQEVEIISDRMRTFPIIYFFIGETLVVTDDLLFLGNKHDYFFSIKEDILEQFLSSNYIIGYDTLYDKVYSTQSGEIVNINLKTKEIKRSQYFKWAPKMEDDSFRRNYQVEAKMQEDSFSKVFNRMVKSAPNVNNWIVPLSGGYDSRIIVNYLYKLGIKNVICFSYGIEQNIQSEISRQVAEALNYQWFFIDYKEWIPKIDNSSLLHEYLKFGFNGVSVPHLQDFAAVYALKEMGVLHSNDIFVPGHAFEVIAGNHLKIGMKHCYTLDSVMPLIEHHFTGFGYYTAKRDNVYNRLKTIISNYEVNHNQIPEYFDWQERQTKFIANSVRVYEYFGYDFRLPEWDYDLIHYWEKIGFNYKLNRNMFKEVFKNFLISDNLKHIPFANDLIEKNKMSLKQFFLSKIPFSFKKILKKRGLAPSMYKVNEGSHLIYSNYPETIQEYCRSYDVPIIVMKYLNDYSTNQKIANFEVNTVSTLLNVRKSVKQKF